MSDRTSTPHEPDRTSEPRGGELRAFLIADVRGYTKYTNEHGDEAGAELARRFADVAEAGVAAHGGRLVELRGDEALAVFTSPRQAVRAALELQRRLRGMQRPDEALPLGIGVGIDAGEAVAIGDGYRGSALNVAARLCSLAAPGEVLATQTLSALAGRVAGTTYRPRRPVRVKGIAEPVRLVEVVSDEPLPPLPRRAGAPTARVSRRAAVAAALAAVALAVAVGVLVFGDEGQAGESLAANSLGRIDTGSGKVTDQIPVGAAPADVVYGAGSLWVVNERDASIWQVDARTSEVAKVPDRGSAPVAAAFGDDALWIADPPTRRVIRMHAVSGRVAGSYAVGNGPAAVAYAHGAAWVANSVDGTVSRIDAASAVDETSGVETFTVGIEPVSVAATRDAVWVANRGSDNVVRIDVESRAPESISVGHEPVDVAVGDGFVWVANAADRTVWKITADEPYSVRATYDLGVTPSALAFAGGSLWVASETAGTVTRIDRDGTIEAEHVGGTPTALEAADGRLWVTGLAARATHRGGTLRISGGFPVTDPHFPSPGANVNPLLNDGLVGFRATSGPGGATLVPNLATSVPKPTDGGRRYAFRLRDGIRYSTGREVRASDFRASLERMFASGTPSREQYVSVRGGRACVARPAACDLSRGVITDDGEGAVTFVLGEPDPLFLYKLAYPPAWVLPPDVPHRMVETRPLPATGPYKIESVVRDRTMILVRNPHFREWSRDAQPAGYPDRIVVEQPRSPQQPVRLVQSGRADTVHGDLPPPVVEQLAVRYPTRLHSVSSFSIVSAVLNTNVRPFDDERVRKALSLAVDRNAVVRALGGPLFGRPTCQLIPPNVLGFEPHCPHTRRTRAGIWSAPDLRAARALVAESGTRGTDVTVWTSREQPFDRIGAVLADALTRLGYRVRTRMFSGNRYAYYNAFGPSRTAQIGPLIWGLDFPVPSDVFFPLLTCGGLNATKFCDEALDRRVATAANLTATDRIAAARSWAALDRDVVGRAVIVPLANESRVTFVSARAGNVQLHPVWGPMYGQMWVR